MREINAKVNRVATVKKIVLDSTYSFWMGYVSMKRWYAYFYEKMWQWKNREMVFCTYYLSFWIILWVFSFVNTDLSLSDNVVH